MQEPKARTKAKNNQGKKDDMRKYDSEVTALQSLRLIAAPDAKDDLSDQELAELCKGKNGFSSELVQNLIEYIKTI